MALSTETRGWFGTTEDPPAQPTTPEDPIKAQIRALIAAGKSDDEIRKALEPRSMLDKAGAIVKGSAKGLIADPLQLNAIKEAAQALPDVARAAAHDETNFMGVPVRTLTEFAKGSGGALAHLGALPYTLGRSIGDALPVRFGGKPEVKASAALSAIDPAAQTEDPWEAWPRRIGNIAALIAAPELIRKARAGGGGGPRPPVPFGAEPTAPGSVPTSTRPITSTPALRGVATVPPTAARPLTTGPWLRMNVPGEAARGGGVVPPGPGGGPAPGPAGPVAPRPLGLPEPPVRKAPPPGARLVKNPPNPIVEAVQQAVEEAQAPVRGGVELPGEPPQPRVTHPSEAHVKALVKAAEERKVREAAARAAQAAQGAQGATPVAGGGTGTSTVPSSTVPPPTTLQKLEAVLGDQRGEVDLTGEKGIPPEGGKLVPAGGEPRGTPAMPTEPERRLAEARDFITEWEQGGPRRAALLDRPLTPEQRISLKMAVAARPGELLDLRNALGMAEPPSAATIEGRNAVRARARAARELDPTQTEAERARSEHPAPLGFQPTPTTSLSDMVAKYGKEGAARRAGMKVSELEARLESGGDPQKLEALLRQREGAAETNRRLGTAGPSTGRLPDAAVERIRAAAAKETASEGGLTDKTRALADRIHAERPGEPKLYSGIDPAALWKVAKKHPALFGAATGGTLGALVGSGGNENEQLGGAVLGAGAGALLSNPGGLLRSYLRLRNQGWLSGGAIAKNLITAGQAPIQSAVENLTPGRGRLSAAKEALRVPTNAKEWWKGTLEAPAKFNPLVPGQSRTPQLSIGGFKPGRLKPSSVIGGIDYSATKMLERAGMSKPDIERLLLTSHRNFTRGGFWRNFDVEPPTAAERARWAKHRIPHAILDAVLPFQRVPTNIITEGLEEMAAAKNRPLSARTAYNVAKTGAAYKIGEKAKESPRNRFLALLALAAAGPATLPATIAMVQGYGPQGSQMLGGMSPFPEIQPNKTLTGWPPSVLTAYKHLVENK